MVKGDFNTNEKIYHVISRFDQEDISDDEAIIELMEVFEEEANSLVKNKVDREVDRLGDWDEISEYMHNYIESKTVSKYGQKSGIDLMSVTDPYICIWNMLKYCLRLWNGQGKRYDLEKIIHYGQMAITLSEGDLSKCGVREDNNPNEKFWKK